MRRTETSLVDLVGTELGAYAIVRRLGVGGMAETFEAIRRGPGGFTQRVCLKLALPYFRDDETFIRLFEREARLAAKLRHSNIVGILDFGEIEGRSYMALELVDGIDLRRLLDAEETKRLAPEYVTLIGLQLAEALEHAHHPPPQAGFEGLVHRDISPSNVLVSRHGEVLLTDFGVAKAMEATAHKQSNVKGKIPYMSPEQLRGERVDGRSDLFGLGVVLFEVLAGARPYGGGHDPATIMLILNGEHPPLAELARDAPEALREVIERLIDPNPERRPQNAAEVLESLDLLAPPPSVRRKLGEVVAEMRPSDPREAQEISSSLRRDPAAGSQPSSETTGVERSAGVGAARPTTAGSRASTSPDRAKAGLSRRQMGWLLAAVGAGLGGVAVGASRFWMPETGERGGGSEQDVTQDPSDTTGPATPVDTAPAPEETTRTPSAELPDPAALSQPEGRSETEDEPVAAANAPKPARLTVIVFPWGNVWVDGKPWGRSPVKDKKLPPGRYRIEVGQNKTAKTEIIRLKPGQRKTLRFDLTE